MSEPIKASQIHETCGLRYCIWGATQEKGSYAICGQRRPRPACAFAQADQGLRCPLTESINIVVYVDEPIMLSGDCTAAPAYLDLCCSHIG